MLEIGVMKLDRLARLLIRLTGLIAARPASSAVSWQNDRLPELFGAYLRDALGEKESS
jgi:hypothetical protein